ncbi:MAG: hypothetical protein V1728_05930 [Candidatus Micrarchaeota archaeon]
MQIPNPYAGNYRLLMILPVVLVLASLISMIFIAPIRSGIEFKGGIQLTIQSAQAADTNAIKDVLEKNGYVVNTIESKANPTGYDTQIEMTRSEMKVKADELKSGYFALTEQVSKAEADMIYDNDSETAANYTAMRAGLNTIADQIFGLAQNASAKASQFNNTNKLDEAVVGAYNQISDKEDQKLKGLIASKLDFTTYSPNEISPSLATSFLDNAKTVVLFSVVLTSIIVFLIFRSAVPSAAVLAGAASDVIIAMGFMSVAGIPLTLASFAALLMLVGFSLDTDILLTIRVMKRKEGHASERAYEAMKTGLTMSMSAIVAFASLYVLASVTHITVYNEIASVALAGLVADMVATWCFNAVIVLHHAEEVEKKGGVGSGRSLMSYIFRS